jgi:O-antigen/teichoic acid export membrane protein
MGSTVRLLSDGTTAFAALVAGAVVARRLGPGGKGTASTLNYLITIFGSLAGLGLGEAAAIVMGRTGAKLQEAVAATLSMVIRGAPLGIVALWASSFVFGDDWRDLTRALVIASLAVPLLAVGATLATLCEAAQELVLAGTARGIVPSVTAVVTVLLVGVGHGGVAASVAGLIVGWSVGVLLFGWTLRRTGVHLRPRRDRGYERAALAYAVPLEAASMLMILAARVDLLVVNAVRGDVPAGHYSVALTLGQLAGYPATALAAASFPRLALLGDEEAYPLFSQLFRTLLVISIAGSALLALVLPIVTPAAFGEQFRPAIGPGLVLVLAGCLGGLQWATCRALAARGDRRVLISSYAATLLVMLGSDVLLLPVLGLYGAALASVAAAAVGLSVALRRIRLQSWPSRWQDLRPRRADVGALVRHLHPFAA